MLRTLCSTIWFVKNYMWGAHYVDGFTGATAGPPMRCALQRHLQPKLTLPTTCSTCAPLPGPSGSTMPGILLLGLTFLNSSVNWSPDQAAPDKTAVTFLFNPYCYVNMTVQDSCRVGWRQHTCSCACYSLRMAQALPASQWGIWPVSGWSPASCCLSTWHHALVPAGMCIDDLAGAVVATAAQNGVLTVPDVDNVRVIWQAELLESYTDFLAVPAGSAAEAGSSAALRA